MREITITAKTVDVAIAQGLNQLGAKKEDISIHIIDYGKKSFLGMFGGKPAIVRLSLNNQEENSILKQIEEITNEVEESIIIEEPSTIVESLNDEKDNDDLTEKNYEQVVSEVKQYLESILKAMGLSVVIHEKILNKEAILKIEGKDASSVIGRRGQTLNALQYLCQLVSNRKHKHYLSIVLDVENYRQKRKETLIMLSNRIYDKVISTKRPYELEPMPAFERKIIHSYMADKKGISTESVGEEPNRHLVISPKK